MQRYSMLWGTNSTGTDKYLFLSPGLGGFMTGLGFTNPDKAAVFAQNTLNASVVHQSIMQQYPSDDERMAVRYAPMHLYKKEEFPNAAKAFCALSICGAENRSLAPDKSQLRDTDGRNTPYSHTILFSQESMLRGEDGYHYLDLLFGNQLLPWQTLASIRAGKSTVDLDAAPEHVSVVFTDLKLALFAANLILEEEGQKNIVIITEKNCTFTKRAMALLKQIYALLPSKVATETGFATYHDVNDVERISSENSMPVFVLPAGADVTKLNHEKNVIVDLSDPTTQIKLEETALIKTLVQWSKLPAEKRVAAYERLSADMQETYRDKEQFVQRSEAWFAAIEQWKTDRQTVANVAGLKELKAFYDEKVSSNMIPWAADDFAIAVKAYHVTKNANLSKWMAEAASQMYVAKDQGNLEEAKAQVSLYNFGAAYAGVAAQDASQSLCDPVADYFVKKTTDQKDEEIGKIRAAHVVEVDKLNGTVTSLQGTLQQTQSELSAERGAHAETQRQLKDASEKCERATALAKRATDDLEPVKASRDEALAKLEKVKHSARRLQKENEELRYRLDNEGHGHGHGHDRSSGVPLWIFIGAIVLGLVLCSLCWFLIPKLAKKDEVPEEVISEIVEPVVEPVETDPVDPEPVDPKPVAPELGWHGEETAQWILSEVPEIKNILTEDLQEYAADVAPAKVLALLTTEDLQPVVEEPEVTEPNVTHPEETAPATADIVLTSNVEVTQTPAADPAAQTDVAAEAPVAAPTAEEPEAEPVVEETVEAEPVEGEAPVLENYALLLDGKLETSDMEDITGATVAVLTEELSVVVYGDDAMVDAAVKALRLIAPKAEKEETEAQADTVESEQSEVAVSIETTEETAKEPADSAAVETIEEIVAETETESETEPAEGQEPITASEQVMICVGDTWIVLDTENLPADWWRDIQQWSTVENDLIAVQTYFNTTSIPVLKVTLVDLTFALYDYTENVEKAAALVTLLQEEHDVALIADTCVLISW